jgi:PncC family amidohydrolase
VWGGVVAYSNQAKEKILSVPADLIGAQGAVSADTALAMARGALAISACDLAVAITGIAGPDGGSREKPVGTVHIAIVAPDGRCDVRNCLFAGTREEIRQASAMKALEIIESFI